MKITICRSFNLDTLIEPLVTVTYSTTEATRVADNRFSIVQNDIEPSMVLKFYDENDNSSMDFSAENFSDLSLTCRLGFKTTLLNQMNSTTSRLTSTYDDRFDKLSYLIIDSERMQILDVSHNKILDQTYLQVKRSSRPRQHYRGTEIKVVRSNPSADFFSRSQGIMRVRWSERDVAVIGIFELEVTFDRISNGLRSRWTISPINLEVKGDYTYNSL